MSNVTEMPDSFILKEDDEPDIIVTELGVPGPQGNLGPQGIPGNQGPSGTGFSNGQPRYSYPRDPTLQDALNITDGANPGDQWLNTTTGDIFTLE